MVIKKVKEKFGSISRLQMVMVAINRCKCMMMMVGSLLLVKFLIILIPLLWDNREILLRIMKLGVKVLIICHGCSGLHSMESQRYIRHVELMVQMTVIKHNMAPWETWNQPEVKHPS